MSTAAEAAVLAAACGGRVELLSRRSETGLTFANPDGTFTSEVSTVPLRVRRGSGWVDVDTTLRRNGNGTLSAVATTVGQVLSGGGSGPLLTFGEFGRRFSLTWPGLLPAPVLVGDTATYPDVLPGVDLRVRVGIDSFRQVLVVKSPEAATNPALTRITFGVTTEGVTLRTGPGGAIQAVDGLGVVVFGSPGAAMWDSPTPVVPPGAVARGELTAQEAARLTAADEATTGGEPTPHRMESIPVQLSHSSLMVLPAQQMLTAGDTLWPVYIDPPFSKPSPAFWTNVMDDNPNHSFYGENSDMRVGRTWQTSNVWRTHMQFNIAELAGSTIVSAELSVTADHTADCASTSIQLWETAYISSPGSYTWYNDSDGDWIAKLDTKTFSANEESCPKGDDQNVFNGSLKSAVQARATNRAGTMTFGLRATNEADYYEWTRFLAAPTSLTIIYNRNPNVPTDQAISDCYLECTSSAVVSRGDPELSVFATDPDPNTILTVFFEVQTSAGSPVASGTVTGYASGPAKPAQPAKWRISPVLGNGSYRWQARTRDEQGAYSPYTAWFAFRTDSTAPLAPYIAIISGVKYYEDDGSGAGYGGIGVQGRLQVSGDRSTVHFKWSLDGGPFNQVELAPRCLCQTIPMGPNAAPRCHWPPLYISPYGTCANVMVTPPKDMVRTLTVEAWDAAGRRATTVYRFRVKSPEPQAGHWKLDGNANDDPDVVTTLHHGTATGVSWVQDRWVSPVGDPYPEGYYEARFAGAGAITTSVPVVATGLHPETGGRRSFAVAAWMRVTDTTTNRVAVSQQGSNKSMFELGYQTNGMNNYCFKMHNTDVVGAAGQYACATTPVVAGEWVHLAGVYDGPAGVMTLYVHHKDVDGFVDPARTEVVTAGFTSVWDATGPFTIGRGYNGTAAGSFTGDIDEVWAWQRIPEQPEVEFLAAN